MAMLGIFRAGQASVAATSAATICKPTTPCAGFSRSLGTGIGPGFDPQFAGVFRKFPRITGLPDSALISLGPSALAFDPQSAIAPAIITVINRLLIDVASVGLQSTPIYNKPTKQKDRLKAVFEYPSGAKIRLREEHADYADGNP